MGRGHWLILLGAICATNALAGPGPENVVVVVNGDSAGSLQVANNYARLRGVPPSNFVVLSGLKGNEYIGVDDFRTQILKPVLQAISERGLLAQIDCITYSTDIPYSVNVGNDIGNRPLPQVLTQPAAITGLTYLTDLTLAKNIDYLQLTANRYSRRLLPIPAGKELTAEEQAEYAGGIAAYDKKDFKKAAEVLTHLLETPRVDPNIPYNLACCQALLGDSDEAILSLRKAVGIGWRNFGQTATDPDLNSLHNLDEFNKLLRVMQLANIELQPGVSFTHSTGWSHAGEADAAGDHYYLSTVLGVTAGRGNSLDQVLDSLERSAEADFSTPKGTIYFERNGDVRAKTREWGFQAAADELEKLGVHAVVEDGTIPQNKGDVAGAMIGISDFDWPASHSTILPGAIVEHLTSFGGMLNQGAGQTPCTEFIKNGASGSSGTVTEPYALQEKFPSPFIQVQYAKGFTLAEAFFQSVSGPYQLLVIGDPLCRPWAKKVVVTAPALKAHSVITSPIQVHPTVAPAVGVVDYQLFIDGKLKGTEKPGHDFTLTPTALGPGYHQVSIVATATGATAAKYRFTTAVTVPTLTVKLEADAGGYLVSAPGAESIGLFALGRKVGSVTGAKGTISVSSVALGKGAQLQAIALYRRNGQALEVRSRPITAAP